SLHDALPISDGGKGFRENFIKRRAIGEPGAEFECLGLESFVAQGCYFRFERIDRCDTGLVSLDLPVICGAEKTFGERAKACHQVIFLLRCVSDVRWRSGLVNRTRWRLPGGRDR